MISFLQKMKMLLFCSFVCLACLKANKSERAKEKEREIGKINKLRNLVKCISHLHLSFNLYSSLFLVQYTTP